MMWIGLTGSIGSGKSTVAEMLQKSGYLVVNADAIAHEGLRSGSTTFNAIVQKLGKQILNSDGEINRRSLGRIIFADLSLRSWLESLIHPMVQTKVQILRKKEEAKGSMMAFYEVPLLFEKKLESQFDDVIVVWVSPEVQKTRLKQRNAWSDEEINQRIQSQLPVDEKRSKANFEINNDGTLDQLKSQVEEVLKTLLEKGCKKDEEAFKK